MGFWHTGYFEFHESTGLDGFKFDSGPPRYNCDQCDQDFDSKDALAQHRFEQHPSHCPVLLLQGKELGNHPVKITAPINAQWVEIENCTRARINGQEIEPASLGDCLSGFWEGNVEIELINRSVISAYSFDFCIAAEEDLEHIEHEFLQMASLRNLDTDAVDRFIAATARNTSALGYCDGICAYLYGVLIKEGHPDVSRTYDSYRDKFNQAAEVLNAYDG